MGIDPNKKVPARYKGLGEHLLPTEYGPYFDASGKPYQQIVRNADTKATALGVSIGSELMVYPHEVYGMTFWHDPQGVQPSINLGVGHVTLPQDAGKPMEELRRIGYEFHEGRSDMEPLVSFADALKASQPAAAPMPAPAPVAPPVVGNDTQPLPSVDVTPVAQ